MNLVMSNTLNLDNPEHPKKYEIQRFLVDDKEVYAIRSILILNLVADYVWLKAENNLNIDFVIYKGFTYRTFAQGDLLAFSEESIL